MLVWDQENWRTHLQLQGCILGREKAARRRKEGIKVQNHRRRESGFLKHLESHLLVREWVGKEGKRKGI